MKKIEKKDISELLIKKYNVNENDYHIINKIVDELYDLNKKNVLPLTEFETFVFRERYGITNKGIPLSKEIMSKKYEIGYKKIEKTINVTLSKLAFRINIIEKINKIDKMSSIDLDNYKKLQDVSVYSFQVSDFIKNKLMKNLIFDLKTLMQFSKKELTLLLNEKNLSELINYIHSLGIKFLDELSVNEKKEIIKNTEEEKIGNSSIYWIDGFGDLNNSFLKLNQIKDIKSLIIKLNELPDMNKFMMSNSIINLGLKDLYVNENKKSR